MGAHSTCNGRLQGATRGEAEGKCSKEQPPQRGSGGEMVHQREKTSNRIAVLEWALLFLGSANNIMQQIER
jgi:hypothetical protein